MFEVALAPNESNGIPVVTIAFYLSVHLTFPFIYVPFFLLSLLFYFAVRRFVFAGRGSAGSLRAVFVVYQAAGYSATTSGPAGLQTTKFK